MKIILILILFLNIIYAKDLDNFIYKTTTECYMLTQEEKNYLSNNKITYAGDPNWLPFEAFNKQKRYIGIIAEHVGFIEQKLNTKFIKIITKDWLETLKLSKKGEVDIISGDSADIVLNQNYRPIDSYLRNPLVVVTNKEHPFIFNLNHLTNSKIAIIDGAGYSADIFKKYPNIKFLKSESLQDGLLGVRTGKYDAFIASLTMIDYTVVKMGIGDLKISGQLDITMHITLFVNKNKPLLYSILNKTMKTISESKQHEIISKWRNSAINNFVLKTDYTLLFQISLAFIMIVLIIFFIYLREKKLKKEIEILNNSLENRIKEEVEKNRQHSIILMQQSRLAQMGEMISMIAHQWRQPLSAISSTVGGLEMKIIMKTFDLDTKNGQEEQNILFLKHFQKIDDFVQNLTTTINDFRDFYKPNKKTVTIKLDLVLFKTLNIAKSSLESDGIKINYIDNSMKEIELYDNEMMQVLLNILKNSQDNFKEKKTKNPQIDITIEEKSISICDNGGGIEEDIIEKIFDPYFSTKNEKNGTGIGLYMSKIIVEEHHRGLLKVKNTETGVCFSIDLAI